MNPNEPSSFGVANSGYPQMNGPEFEGQPRFGLATSVPICPSTQELCVLAVSRCDGCQNHRSDSDDDGPGG